MTKIIRTPTDSEILQKTFNSIPGNIQAIKKKPHTNPPKDTTPKKTTTTTNKQKTNKQTKQQQNNPTTTIKQKLSTSSPININTPVAKSSFTFALAESTTDS